MKREIFVGRVGIGGRHPVSIQSMTNTPAGDVGRTLAQIAALEQAGCQIVRLAVPDREALASFRSIVRRSPLPVIADIHFDASLALAALEAGSAAIRINPGNIGGARRLKEIVRLAGQRKIPIRIGVNAGSLEKKYLTAGRSRPQMMVSSALDKIRLFEDLGFHDIKVSLKSSSVKETVEAYRLMDKRCDYPLHLGLTEAGPWLSGTVKSAIAIGSLLLDGIGNTVRVSLTADPVQEVQVARQILLALGRLDRALEIISCPTCARCSVDLLAKIREFEAEIANFQPQRLLRVAIMGCEVNGPGEARHADVGLAFSRSSGYLFRGGKKLGRVSPERAIRRLVELVRELGSRPSRKRR